MIRYQKTRTPWLFWLLFIIGLSLVGVATARAGGFAVAEQSAVAGGTAGASTARTDDAGAAWYNPAALADGGGLRVGAGLLAAMPSLHAEAMDGSWRTDSESGISTPPHLQVSYAAGSFVYGAYFGVPFGSGVTWPEGWEGRHEILASRLEVFRLAPFAGWRRGKLRIAGGLHLDMARLRLQRTLDFVDTEGDVKLDLDARGVGVHASAFYEASAELAVGLSYKSRTRLGFRGGANFTAPDAFSMKTADQMASVDMTLPDSFALGARWQRGRLSLLGDVVLTLWSVNQQTVIDFDNEATPDPVQTNEWKSTVGLRAGGEVRLGKPWVLRAGAFYDPSPARVERLAPSSPDSNRLGLTVGASHQLRRDLSVDAFYEYMALLTRAAENMDALEARYGGTAQILGVGVRLRR